ncbi:hypothetical protein [Hahella sp. HN01]|uniref:hypothetical protein n=1 Tax=Hahella sp. HN01 TaxID=2847262 RepID=UPI001C1E9850|nr:hypothetical protein [Hahella sp. HN01]MBU6951379.1 hypothetical protein [Hahella sp. HN01]
MDTMDVWEVEVRHQKLDKFRIIRGHDKYLVNKKITIQQQIWNEMWRKKAALADKKKQMKVARAQQEKIALANSISIDTKKEIANLVNLLHTKLSDNYTSTWGRLLDKEAFAIAEPDLPELQDIPPEPARTDAIYQIPHSFWHVLFPNRKYKKEQEAEKRYLADKECWARQKKVATSSNRASLSSFALKREAWCWRKLKHEKIQREIGINISRTKEAYFEGAPHAIVDYCDVVLGSIHYPEYFPQCWELRYNPESMTLVIDYSLPDIESLPSVKSVAYSSANDTLEETHLSAAESRHLYSNTIRQVSLITLYSLFKADAAKRIRSIAFNGWIDSLNRSTREEVKRCILTLFTHKHAFPFKQLDNMDPRACFNALHGDCGVEREKLAAVAPIIMGNAENRSFNSAFSVDNCANIAEKKSEDYMQGLESLFTKEKSLCQ